jgi:U3 small nucleolar RNA-associated protein 25
LDAHCGLSRSSFFRQTIVASSFVFPELLNLYSKSLLNISGKRLITITEPPAMRGVRTGIRQVFTRFDCADAQREADLRFKTFTGKVSFLREVPHNLLQC